MKTIVSVTVGVIVMLGLLTLTYWLLQLGLNCFELTPIVRLSVGTTLWIATIYPIVVKIAAPLSIFIEKKLDKQ